MLRAVVGNVYSSARMRLSKQLLRDFYYWMSLTRRMEARVAALGKEGKTVGNLFSSLGQEAISVGTTLALRDGDLVAPMIRNLGTVLIRGYTVAEMFAQFMARADSPGRGRDSNYHFGDAKHGVIGCISHLGPLVSVMTGAAMGARMLGRPIVTMTYLGEGGCSTGDFHEGLNLAAVQNAPFVLVVENNGWAYSTPIEKQTRQPHLCKRADAYGIAGRCGDGNDVTEVYRIAGEAVEAARGGEGPQLVEFMTFRRKGHAEHDDAKYVPPAVRDEWIQKDPIDRLSKKLSAAERAGIDARIERELADGEAAALKSPLPDPATARRGVYADDTLVEHAAWWK